MAQTVAQLQSRLDAIDTAIASAQTAQSIGSDSTSLSRAQLSTLYAERVRVQRQLDTATAFASGRSRLYSRGRITGMGPAPGSSVELW